VGEISLQLIVAETNSRPVHIEAFVSTPANAILAPEFEWVSCLCHKAAVDSLQSMQVLRSGGMRMVIGFHWLSPELMVRDFRTKDAFISTVCIPLHRGYIFGPVKEGPPETPRLSSEYLNGPGVYHEVSTTT
jgi:hypothetical protein